MTVFNGDTTAPQYIHTLTVTRRLGGNYTCTVSNDKPSSASASYNVPGIITAMYSVVPTISNNSVSTVLCLTYSRCVFYSEW